MEQVMQYMWQWRLYGSPDKHLTDGRPVRIINPGLLNTASGPDFFNAKIKLDGMEWAGNVELHVKAGDWYRHGHSSDAAYDSVMLHVVGENDTYIRRKDGSLIPQLLMPFTREVAERYAVLAADTRPLRCRAYIGNIPTIYLHDTIDACAMERLHTKAERVKEMLRLAGFDYAQATFITIARALGFGINAEPMERLARALPLTVAAKHADSHIALEALLVGMAGLLQPENLPTDEYASRLAGEWEFLSHKFSLHQLPAHIWKFSGTRPAASPLRRLIYLSRLLRNGSSLLSRIIDAEGEIEKLNEIFRVKLDGYWATHLSFGHAGTRSCANAIGKNAGELLLINAVAPIYQALGADMGKANLYDAAADLLHRLPPESNHITRMWKETCNYTPADAWESQGLIQLHNAYCLPGNCLRCRLALQSMKRSIPHNKPS